MAFVTPTDRLLMSVFNRCTIEVFCCVFVLSLCVLDFSVGIKTFVIGMINVLFLFLLIASSFHYHCGEQSGFGPMEPG